MQHSKQSIAEHLSAELGIGKKVAGQVVDHVLGFIGDAVKAGDTIQIRGFGTFSRKSRAAGVGRNPRTGEAVDIPAHHLPAFKPSRELKAAVNEAREYARTGFRFPEGWDE